MPGEREIKRAAAAVGEGMGKETGKRFKKTLKDVLNHGFAPQSALGLSDAMLEGVYGQAYRLYNTGKYKEAVILFKFLMMVNSAEPKYSMGFAACYHMLKDYKHAIILYTMCGVVDPESPIPHYHVSDCYIQLNDPVSAIVALDMAVKRAGIKPEYQALKDRALLTIQSLRNEMGKGQEQKKKFKEKHKKT